jgi:luciferase family oxidoreductase group 1
MAETAPLRLSVLDQSVSLAGSSEDAAIRDTLSLAEHCEALGYARFWLSEHHGLPTIVGSAPEILMAAIAARTSRIRIGSAGVMLPHYSALKVAEQFRVLEALAPGRIDLGVGRAPGGDMRTARALNPHAAHAAEDFPVQVRDLHAWTSVGRHAGITAHPLGPHAPEIWILGSSDYGAQLAAHFGLPYAFAYFFTDGVGAEQAIDLYRRLYQPSERHPRPEATVCIWALVAATDEEAAYQALSRDRWRIDRARGVLGPLQSPAEIAARGFDAAEEEGLAPMRARAFVGSIATVRERIERLVQQFALDEVVVNTWAHDPAVRRISYALLAESFGLTRAART